MHPLEALSPLDGRYHDHTKVLAEFFSEEALIRYRIRVECEYLIALCAVARVLRPLSIVELHLLRDLPNISLEDAELIKTIEKKGAFGRKATNHDVKAIEYYIRYRLEDTSLRDVLPYVHFALTSEDVNNIAYGVMLSAGVHIALKPVLESIFEILDGLEETYRYTQMLARTHGQPASPTTLGKEMAVFGKRLVGQYRWLVRQHICVKLNGASGNWNAHCVAYPDIDWVAFSASFISKFESEFEVNRCTTQIEPHDTYAELFDIMRRLNTVLMDFCQDMWRYISDGWIVQKPKEGEVGSSTMPHKVNPIDFENAEGNLGLANALFEFFSRKLPISRLQRDLSDSTVTRNFGVAFGHSLVAYQSILRGLEKISADKEKIRADLLAHPEVITEGIQTILRREGREDAYERIAELSRGKKLTEEDIHEFINGLDVGDSVKMELHELSPETYIGYASKFD